MRATKAGMLEPAAEAPSAPVKYPISDGKAMADSGWQAVAMVLANEALRRYFRERDGVYVGLNMLLYYEEGNPGARLAPDVFVAFGVGARERDTYKVWEEGKPPDFVLEVASEATERRDPVYKSKEYARIGVREYWRLDPKGWLMERPLEGYRLEAGGYERLEPVDLEDGSEGCWSEALGLHLRGKRSREVTVAVFRDPRTERDVLTGADIDRALREAQEKVLVEERAKLEAQAQVRQAREQVRQADEQVGQADEQARQADEQAQQADEQAQRADERARQEEELRRQAEARVRRVEERLAELERKHKAADAPD